MSVPRLRAAFERLLEAATIVLMICLALIVVVAVAFRWSGNSLSWYDEVASVLLAWLTYWASALAALKGAHIGVPGIVRALPPAPRLVAVALAEAFVIGFFVVLAWFGLEVLRVLEGSNLVSLTWVSLQLTQAVIPIGAVLFAIAQLLNLPGVLAAAAGRVTEDDG